MADPILLLAPGASGGLASLRPHLRGLRKRGIDARTVELPRSTAERAVPAYRAALEAEPDAAIGGHSFGGRVASILAADGGVSSLVLLSYPLHAPGRAERWDERTEHWPRIACPVLLLSGEADPFARIELLRRAVGRLEQGELVTYPGIHHGLAPVLDEALDRIAKFLQAHT